MFYILIEQNNDDYEKFKRSISSNGLPKGGTQQATLGETEVWSGYNFGIENDTDIMKKLKNGECQLMKDFWPVNGSMDSKFDFLTKLDQANLISGCI